MALPTSTQERGHLWSTPIPYLLLLLLFPGSRALSKTHQLHKVAGQMFSMSCRYPPRGRPYQKKGWCKEVSAFRCITLVTSSKPRTLVQASRFSILDEPHAGFFTVFMINLREEDSRHYWCKLYHPSSNSVVKSVRVYLAMSPARITLPQMTSVPQSTASASTKATWVPDDLVTSWTHSYASPAERAREAPGASSTIMVSSQKQNSTLSYSPAATRALVPMLCGFFMAKILVLSALLVWNQHVRHGKRYLTQLRPQAPECFLLSPTTQKGQPVSLKPVGASLTSELCVP